MESWFTEPKIPLGRWVKIGITWLQDNAAGFFDAVTALIDFLVDGRTWMIREVVVECGHWYAGNKVIVPTEKISRINYELRTVHVDSTKQAFGTASEQHHQTHAA